MERIEQLLLRDPLDLRLYLVLFKLATASGRVGQSGTPLTFSRLVRLLSHAGYHGKPAYRPSIQSLRSAIARLEGVPGDKRFPRLVRSLTPPRGTLIFQVEMGRGQLRLVAPANTAGNTALRPTKRVSANTAANTFLEGSFSIEKGVREADPVDKSRAREHLARLKREIFARGPSS